METRTQQDARLRAEIETRLRRMGTDAEVTRALTYYDRLPEWQKSNAYVEMSLNNSALRWEWFHTATQEQPQ